MRVVLDARVHSGVPGGIQQVILGVARGLAELDDERDDYGFLVVEGQDDWIRGHVQPPGRLVHTPAPTARALGDRVARRVRRTMRSLTGGDRGDLDIDRPLQASGADVVHLLRQNALGTSIPSIYHPYDLQHLHLPELFSAHERADRERFYGAHCRAAAFVVMMTRWAKDDLCARLDVPGSKVAVVGVPPFVRLLVSPSAARIAEIRARYRLPARFALFPAQTWAHKNHLTLLKALSMLRDDGRVAVPLVCCGTQNAFFADIRRAVKNLGLEDQVSFLGWVDEDVLYALYSAARCLVFPSRFEGWGMPVMEAFETRIPVACTDAPWLPDEMRGAVQPFDPSDPSSIADAIEVVWNDGATRSRLIEEGTRRAGSLSWTRVGETFRAMYRAAAGAEITARDRALLAEADLVR